MSQDQKRRLRLVGVLIIYAMIIAIALFFADQFWIANVAARILAILSAPILVFVMFTGTKKTENNSDN